MCMIGVFEPEEQAIRAEFIKRFENEVNTFNDLLKVYEAFLDVTAGKVKDTDYPKWTILLLMSQTLPLMNNAFQLLTTGYLRSSEIIVRICGEAAILSAYFKEFPEAEEDYRKLHYSDFFHKHRMEKMLKEVEKSAKYFFSKKLGKNHLHKVMFTNLYTEASRFVHNDLGVIEQLMTNHQMDKEDKHYFVKGPQLYPNDVLGMGLRRLFNTLIVSVVILGVSLDIAPDADERSIIDKSTEITNNLNSNNKNE